MSKPDYAAIAAKHIKKTTDLPPRLLIYGKNKKGKTHLAATAPNVLILDPVSESGTKAETAANPDVWPIREWTDLNDVYQCLAHGITSPTTGEPYKWVNPDGCTRFYNMALRYVTGLDDSERDLTDKPPKVTQPQYGAAAELFKSMVYNFQNLPQGVLYTAQERVIEAENQEEHEEVTTVFRVADLPDAGRATLNAAVDLIGRVYTITNQEDYRVKLKSGEIETRTRYNTKYRLWLAPHPAYDTGFRTPRKDVPDYIEDPTVEKILALLKETK